MTLIDSYTEMGRTFLILQNGQGFWGIEQKYICNGKLTKPFDGMSGHLTKRKEDTIHEVSIQIKADSLVAKGMDPLEATLRACGYSEEDIRMAGCKRNEKWR